MAKLFLILFTIVVPQLVARAACVDDLVANRYLSPIFYKQGPADPLSRSKHDLYKLALILEDMGLLLPNDYLVLPERMSSLGMFQLAETRNTRGVFLRPRDVVELRNSSPPYYFRERHGKVILVQRKPPGHDDISVYEFDLGDFRHSGLINATVDARPLFARYFAAFQFFEDSFHLYSLQNLYIEKAFPIRPNAIWPRWREFVDSQMRIVVRIDKFVEEHSLLPGIEDQIIRRPTFLVDSTPR